MRAHYWRDMPPLPEARMPALHDLQQAFMAALLAEEAPTDVAGLAVTPAGVSGVEVHRHTMRANLHGALRIGYPVVERLVGAEFFAYAAQAFIASQPSLSPNLEDYGAGFDEFLRAFAPASELPYLADVAMFEAAIDSVARAPDDTAEYQLHSQYPILRIWQVNQPGLDGDERISLDAGAVHLRVYRERGEVLIEAIDAAAALDESRLS